MKVASAVAGSAADGMRTHTESALVRLRGGFGGQRLVAALDRGAHVGRSEQPLHAFVTDLAVLAAVTNAETFRPSPLPFWQSSLGSQALRCPSWCVCEAGAFVKLTVARAESR